MEETRKNPFDLFAENQQTYQEALEKSAEESSSYQQTKYFRMDSDGTYTVRILPLAPVQQADGTWLLERKGYEYPIKTQVLRLTNPNSTSKKDKQFFVNVCQTKYAGLSVDLIDTYLKVAESKYGDDEKLMDKIKASGFEGGLKWNSQRMMYVVDMDKPSDGIQLLTLSYSQYKSLEEQKLEVWKELLEGDPKTPCPISSIQAAYPVKIIRKKNGKKTEYSFTVNTVKRPQSMTEDELNTLLGTPRIPEAAYRYSRFHLEATIEYLKQYDEQNEMDVMGSKEIADAIDKIKMELPADDKSHFSFDKKERKGNDDEEQDDDDTIEGLWNRWEALKERGVGDKSDEGQELRDAIRNFIDDNELPVRVTRGKTNEDLLVAIDDALENTRGGDDDDAEPQDETPNERQSTDADEDNASDDDADDDEEMSEHERGERKDDTDEPAAEAEHERRTPRPVRRRMR